MSTIVYTVYGGAGCPYCEQAKQLLDSLDIPYVYLDVWESDAALKELQKYNLKTIPQIWDGNNNYVGGYQELREALNA